MDCTAAAHRLKIGVPATIEHSAGEDGAGGGGPGGNGEHSKWVAETTQVSLILSLFLSISCKVTELPVRFSELYHVHGRFEAQTEGKRSTASFVDRFDEWLYTVQSQ